jgi:methyl-accepting chemotaxis protein
MPAENAIAELLGTGAGGAGGGVVLTLLAQKLMGKNGDKLEDIVDTLEEALNGVREKVKNVESTAQDVAGGQREVINQLAQMNNAIQRSNEILAEMRGFFQAGGSRSRSGGGT